ncbi:MULTISPECIES: prolyl oligopeptidase family serine peptidase [Mycobacterium]|uniref:Prolyl oligopeptidase n=1 Tax=Mycobacterium gordonae TaxID=1778 RepID=A0A1X1W0Y4_MYCGO|nr:MULTISPECIES: prolyl oligopeptidase family protein [Mycobacterium]MBI2702583.1 S9 family peptidase [Mycobacterium sp.]MBX9980483.1 prolyl oligopeptidase family protein [Mycobacterium gordonae]MCQ4362621.1 prolyl oligopeptidase family protein [Mycobacterium gordonae]MCV7004962.1 S9 family peptidase [Mycobacterium gordonae]ODR22973.1 prolyl oligopeptidase [Mycobacterium gordonae]
MASMSSESADDPYLWLEDVTGDKALDWVRARNEPTRAEFCDAEFETMRTEALQVLDTDARIPYVRRRGDYLYDFWRDATNPRGLWRRTTLESYRTDTPEWDVLIDVDALGRADNRNWVWAGADVIEPELTRALINLSPGGSDAVVVREFDMLTREFVADGFELPEAKSQIGWDDPDTVLVGTDFGPDSMTESGYPRILKRWRRGTPLTEAETLFEGERSDVSAGGSKDRTPGFERTFVGRSLDFWNRQRYELRGTELIPIDVPTDVSSMSVHREWLLIDLRSDWTVGDTTYRAGSLLAANYDEFLAGARELTVVFEPDEHTCLYHYAWTRDRLLVVSLADVASRVEIVTPGSWRREPLAGLPESTNTVISAADETGDEFFLDSSGFTAPSRLLRGTGSGGLEQIKSAPSFFDAENIAVEQYFVASQDGTSIPYFVVRPTDTAGPAPTLLYGYGGFETSNTPGYSGVLGRLWLARGGTYVLANIRGGGEYGPAWHTQAMREGRHKVAEDFVAVADDLVRRGITTVGRLGAQGGSNGGLLMGIMLTKYPEKFGALVCSVPLLDMKRYHLLLAGASWVAEYGDPDNPDDWAFISEYSPYQNISADREYPPILMTTSTRDDRVHPGHARKMTAALEATGHRVWYYENIEGGHGGAADNEQLAFKAALSYSFLWRMLRTDT